MPVEITGVVHYNSAGTLFPRPLSEFDLDHIINQAKVHERAGFDRVLIANSAVMPDPMAIGAFISGQTKTLRLMLAHRPGVIAPTAAARMLATIDQLSQGRAAVHIIAGPNDRELQADGDYLTKDQRYHRSLEYVQILRKLWSATEPIDHAGEFYRFTGAMTEVKPVQKPSLPIFWGGASDLAIAHGALVADTYALTGDSLKGAQELMAPIQAAAAAAGRALKFQITFIVILGDTEAAAWALADQRLQQFLDLKARREREEPPSDRPTNFTAKTVNFNRSLKTAEEGVRLDRCFWTAMNKATQAQHGNQSTLVGTPAQVAEALMDYYDLGISNFLLRGYDALPDADLFGQELIPMVRARVAQRDADRRRLAQAMA